MVVIIYRYNDQTVVNGKHYVDPKEVATFNSLADQWWDEGGEFKPLYTP